MPAPIIAGVVDFLSQQLNFNVWEGEIPRYDQNGHPIYPEASTVNPQNYPILRVTMSESGFTRNNTFEDAYDDIGDLTIQVWANTRAVEESMCNEIETLLGNYNSWKTINLPGGVSSNPYYVISMILKSWTSVAEEGNRDPLSMFLYRGDMHFETRIHGAVIVGIY